MIDVFVKDKLTASFMQDKRSYFLEYKEFDIRNSIALSLPNTKRFYTYDYRFPPFFETFLPEGYLYEIFKNLLTKEYGYIDDYLIFSKLSPNIKGRVTFKSDFSKLDFDFLDIDNILKNDTDDTFHKLLTLFMGKNAISGVQPKTVAILKETLHIKEYIIKTWGQEYPNLCENEYFCLKACEYAGLKIPNIKLSKNKRFLIVENFITKDREFGFEEILSLMDKNRGEKYSGSYEQVAKIIYQFTTNKKETLQNYYKMIVMNYLLKNGDAHLKNFALLFESDFSSIFLSPVYDVVCTNSYIYRDKPALMLGDKKIWWGKDALVKFGIKHCLLSENEAKMIYKECKDAVFKIIKEIEKYIKEHPNFENIGKKMVDIFNISLRDETIKELPYEFA